MSNKGHSALDNLTSQMTSLNVKVGDLAKSSNTSDLIIHRLRNGASIETHLAQRIADALGVSLATLGQRVF